MYIDVSQLQEKTFDIGNNHSYIFSLIQETNLKDLLVHTFVFLHVLIRIPRWPPAEDIFEKGP